MPFLHSLPVDVGVRVPPRVTTDAELGDSCNVPESDKFPLMVSDPDIPEAVEFIRNVHPLLIVKEAPMVLLTDPWLPAARFSTEFPRSSTLRTLTQEKKAMMNEDLIVVIF